MLRRIQSESEFLNRIVAEWQWVYKSSSICAEERDRQISDKEAKKKKDFVWESNFRQLDIVRIETITLMVLC
jgi:hypothetical protein